MSVHFKFHGLSFDSPFSSSLYTIRECYAKLNMTRLSTTLPLVLYCSFSPHLSPSPTMGMPQAAFGKAVPMPPYRSKRIPQHSPSSQWEAVAGVACLPRSHRVRNCRLPAFRRSLIARGIPFFAASLFRSCVKSVPASWSIRFSRCLREGAGIAPYTKHVFQAGFTIPFSAFSKSLQLYLWLF